MKEQTIEIHLPNKKLTVTEGKEGVKRILLPLSILQTKTKTDLAVIIMGNGNTITYSCPITLR